MPHTRFNITNDKICSTIIYRLQIFVIPAFQTFFCHQMAGIQFLFTANQIVSMSYCHENQSFITYRLFFQTKYDEIMSMNVTPSTKTDLLDVTFDSDGNMLDSNGNYVEDNDSITSSWYYQTLATQSSSSSDGSGSGNSGSDSSDASDDNSEG